MAKLKSIVSIYIYTHIYLGAKEMYIYGFNPLYDDDFSILLWIMIDMLSNPRYTYTEV